MYKINMSYALSLCNIICQMYFNKKQNSGQASTESQNQRNSGPREGFHSIVSSLGLRVGEAGGGKFTKIMIKIYLKIISRCLIKQ